MDFPSKIPPFESVDWDHASVILEQSDKKTFKVLQVVSEGEVLNVFHCVQSLLLPFDRKFKKSIKIHEGFQGNLAVSILRNQLAKLRQEPYKILVKTNGTRYWLLSMIHPVKLKPQLFLINRSFNVYKVPIDEEKAAESNLFHGTLLDGELIRRTNGNIEFEVFDCLVTEACYVGSYLHNHRLDFARNCSKILQNVLDSKISIDIQVKNYISKQRAQEVITKLENMEKSQEEDGLLFINPELPYVPFKDYNLFKYKPLTDHTIDFQIYVEDGHVCLRILKQHVFHSVHTWNTLDDQGLQTFLETLGKTKDDLSSMHGSIVECLWKEKLWFPLKMRDDKNVPNNYETFIRTLQNIEENITKEELFHFIHE